jgi:hypothetical protein
MEGNVHVLEGAAAARIYYEVEPPAVSDASVG